MSPQKRLEAESAKPEAETSPFTFNDLTPYNPAYHQ